MNKSHKKLSYYLHNNSMEFVYYTVAYSSNYKSQDQGEATICMHMCVCLQAYVITTMSYLLVAI